MFLTKKGTCINDGIARVSEDVRMKPRPTYKELEIRVKELERKLSGRLSFEYLIKYISTSFVNLPVEKIDHSINRAIRLLADFIGASRSAIFVVSDDVKTFENTHAWNDEEPDKNDRLREPIPFEHFGYFWEQLCRSEFVIINRCDDIPSKAVLEREWYESNSFRSLLFIPMILEKRIYGLLSFSGPPHEVKNWPEEFIILIRLIADRFMNLLNRKNVEVALLQSKKLSESLLNATTDSAMLITPAGTILTANVSFCSMLGKKPGEIIGANLFDLTPQELVQNRKTQIDRVIAEKKRISFEDESADRCYHHVFYPVFNASGAVDRLAYYSHDVTGVKRVEKSIRHLTNELIKGQESERQKIANDLHDNVAQELASLRIHCDALFDQIPGMPPHARDVVSGFSKTIKNSIETVRELAYDLQPPSFDHKGLVKTLYRYCEDFSQKTGVRVDFFSAGMNVLRLDFNTENTLHRIVREALANVKAHAGAAKVTVRLVASYPTIMLRIEDNGKGFDVTTFNNRGNGNKPMGLKNMEGRVRLQNGKIRILSKPGAGTRILAELPFSKECHVSPVPNSRQ
ncbi:MAG: histidine kinase [Desulfobacteraceae bacterium]|jgi:PAS domain S-box-containing protein